MTAINSYDKLDVGEVVDSDDEDRVRVYGALTDSTPLHGTKLRDLPDQKDEEGTEIPLQHFQFSAQQQDPLLKSDRKSFRPGEFLPGRVSSHSLSTWSSETIVSTRSFSDTDSWLRHPKVRENWRVVLGSFLLTALGVVLIIVGVAVVASPQRGLHCLVFFIIGLLCFIPGVYHLIYIYLAVLGRPGYSFYDLPVFK